MLTIIIIIIIINLVLSMARPEKLLNPSSLSFHLYKKEIKICILIGCYGKWHGALSDEHDYWLESFTSILRLEWELSAYLIANRSCSWLINSFLHSNHYFLLGVHAFKTPNGHFSSCLCLNNIYPQTIAYCLFPQTPLHNILTFWLLIKEVNLRPLTFTLKLFLDVKPSAL